MKEMVAQIHKVVLQNKDKVEIKELEFEKDCDENKHIDFITFISNFRATNYKIEQADRSRVKLLAGKIIPAIATTTAVAVGAVGVEIYKMAMKVKPDLQRNFFSNLALPVFHFSEPSPPVVYKDKEYDEIVLGPVKALPPKYNTWTRIDIKGPLTINQVKDQVRKEYGFNISTMMVGKETLMSNYDPKVGEVLNKTVEQRAKELNIPFYKGKRYLMISIAGETDDMCDVMSPYIKYALGE